jgi:HAD superfamily hydrolase (TIGR01549 family)
MAAILGVGVKDYAAAWHVIDRRIEEGSWTPSNDDRWVELYGGLVDMLHLSFRPEEVATRFSRLFRSVDSYAPFAEVPQTLAELRASGLRVAVLSNSDFPLEPILDACGIGAFVEVAIPAVMYGTTKPRPEAFMLCCDALKLDPADCWFVGDRLIDDVTASADLGMRSVLVDREGRYSNDALAFPRLPDLSYLPTLIAQTL